MVQLLLVAASFAIVIILVSRRWQMAYAMALGALLLAFATGTGLHGFGHALVVAVTSLNTYELAGGVLLISLLARLLREFGLLERMTDSLAALLGNVKLALALVPGLLGCLPVFGGAIMSAPMVDSLGDELGYDGARKSAINLIFRHAWFFIFPFSPALLLAATMSGRTPGAIISYTFPLTFVTLISGYLYLFRTPGQNAARQPAAGEVAATAAVKGPDRGAAAREFLLKASPLILAVVLTIGFKTRLVFAMLAGVTLAILLARKHPQCNIKTIWHTIDWMLVLTMFSIMLFKGVLDQAGFIKTMVLGLAARGIPPVVLFVVLPMVTGIATGAHQTAIAVCLPLLLPLASGNAPAVALIYSACYLGYFVSPLHLCTLLTAEYFKARLADVYRGILPIAAVLTVAVGVMAVVTGGGMR